MKELPENIKKLLCTLYNFGTVYWTTDRDELHGSGLLNFDENKISITAPYYTSYSCKIYLKDIKDCYISIDDKQKEMTQFKMKDGRIITIKGSSEYETIRNI